MQLAVTLSTLPSRTVLFALAPPDERFGDVMGPLTPPFVPLCPIPSLEGMTDDTGA